MEKNMLKEKVDTELTEIVFTDAMKRNVMTRKKKYQYSTVMKRAATFAAVLLLGGTTVFAGYRLINKVNVNEAVLPELEPMEIVSMQPLTADADEYGMFSEKFTDYAEMKSRLGIGLLDSQLAGNNPYMQGKIRTDNRDFAEITVENYILGDTANYKYIPEEEWYEYEHGVEFYSPVSLSADIILSEEQLINGWDTDYLGMYEHVQTYTSAQGYTVHLIQDTVDSNTDVPEDYVSKKCAVFVADGIRYTLECRTSMENMKMVVDTLE